ncbi:PDF receptor-like isoform X2 [Acanthaster planci]|uniref:PDF receptor-like isoform X2 n=1 Tax=Acanthaster planci TaxID=133434 RepID=A0A8B7XIY4_ACAPL|nr:PDF receptor-like isoform X2 [Acanthaster planci]
MGRGEDECAIRDQQFNTGTKESLMCPPDWDTTLCWPATPANSSVVLKCPNLDWFDPDASLSRFCGANATWESGGTYRDCFVHKSIPTRTPDYDDVSDEKIDFYLEVLQGANFMRLIGVCLSWVTLVVALLIFSTFRSLNCNRIKIHKHFFAAFLIRMTLEVILVADRRHKETNRNQGNIDVKTIHLTPVLCETFETIREYGRLCAFFWMFIEGFYLTCLVSANVFGKPRFLLYYIVGWLLPVPIVISWAIAMYYTSTARCWKDHAVSPYYLIIEVPRNGALIINVLFLVNIVRVLVTKLRDSNSSETKQIRKAAKGAVLLIPLLGVANLVWFIPNPTARDSRASIVLYNYLFLFLDSYQGFFLCVMYCFLNQEVRMTIHRKWSTWRYYRDPLLRRTSVLTSTTEMSTTRAAYRPSHRPNGSALKMAAIDEISSTHA